MNLIPLLIVFLLFMLNVPIGFALIGGSMTYFLFMSNNMPPQFVLQNFISGIESFPVPTMSIVYNLVTSFVRSRNIRKIKDDKDAQNIDEGISIFDYVEDDANIDKISENKANETAETSTDDKANIQDEIKSEEMKKSKQKRVKNKKR